MVAWGAGNLENLEFIQGKAKTKANGVYTARGVAYRVKDNRVTHYSNLVGWQYDILESYGAFSVSLGRVDSIDAVKKKMSGV